MKVVDKVVISLPDSHERRNQFFERKSAKEFRVFPAFDGRKEEVPDFFDVNGFTNWYKRPPLPGEIGCTVSHYLVIKEFAEGDGQDSDVLLVAEDDAFLSDNLDLVVNKILSKSIDFEFCMLTDAVCGTKYDLHRIFKKGLFSHSFKVVHMSVFSRRVFVKKNPHMYTIGTASGVLFGTGLYMITRKSARKYCDYVKNVEKLSWKADGYACWPQKMGMRISIVRPNLADSRYRPGTSTILDDSPESKAGQAPNKEGEEKSNIVLLIRGGLVDIKRILAGKVKGVYRSTMIDVRRYRRNS
ncbi:glycosyltransferase family 25 protein [Dermabacteraceae bacterium P7006]